MIHDMRNNSSICVFKKLLPSKMSNNNVMKTKDPIQKWKIFIFSGIWEFGFNFNPHFQTSNLLHGYDFLGFGPPLNLGW